MAKLPHPPPARDLAGLSPDWRHVPAGTALFRVYSRRGRYPVGWHQFRRFGPTDARFDHHLPPPHVQDRGILYAALHPRAALAEVFQRRRAINVRRGEPWLVGFEIVDSLRLLDLTGLWPTRAGASMAMSSGPHARTRPWARAIYDAYPKADGLWYGSSMDTNTPCVALFEQAMRALPPRPAFHRALADAILRAPLELYCQQLNYRLLI